MTISRTTRPKSIRLLSTLILGVFILATGMSFSSQPLARDNPGWGNAALVCTSPRIGNDSPDLNFGGRKNSFETGFYRISRLPDAENRFLGIENNNSEKVGFFPTNASEPVRWLITGVGSDLYQISTCHKGQPRCLILSDDKQARLGDCVFEAYGNQAWWNVGIVSGPGKGGWSLGSDGIGRTDCMTETTDTGRLELTPCLTSSEPDVTWKIEPATPIPKTTISASEFPKNADVITYQCESHQTIRTFYDEARDLMQVSYQGEFLKLNPVISGSGAKFGGPQVPWGWWTKSNKGFIFTYGADGTEGEFIERCIEVHPTTNADQMPQLDQDREWSTYGTKEEIVLADCRDCGDDIGIMLTCQGPTNPALVSVNWAATEKAPSSLSLTIEINGTTYERTAVTVNNGLLGQVPQFELHSNDPLIKGLKRGTTAKITFGNVTTQIGLRGSNFAFEVFDAHCGWKQAANSPESASPAIWYHTEYFDQNKNKTVNLLSFGIPETDATALLGFCDAGSSTIELNILLDTGGHLVRAPFPARFKTAAFDKTYVGHVFSDNSEFAGVRFTLPVTNPLWAALSLGQPVHITPQSGSNITLNDPATVHAVDEWLNQCQK